MEVTCHLDSSDLQDYVKKVFGSNYLVVRISKLNGGAQKVVYKLGFSNGFSCVLYIWDPSSNYFQEEQANRDINERSYGSDLFELNNQYLIQQGIRTPALYDLNKERTRYPFDYALVEYVDGHKAEDYFHHPDLKVQDELFQKLGDMLARMHSNSKNSYGKLNHEMNNLESCHLLQMENAKEQLTFSSQYLEFIRVNESRLNDTLYELGTRIKPRRQYGFIHGELGPDHVLINNELDPFLIDIEGAMFFDIEHEHSFLEFRFGDFYRYIKNDALDYNRMLFYQFHHHISLISGGLKLLHRGFPNKQFAKDLVEYHLQCTMRFIESFKK